ncbi:MAG TPA: TlpA disulfide reductase family protein [Tepidiformaceae bacterium]|nr:TlpA disulfide reductase family protein [Tepidiformaceae bacterium]
METEEQGTEAPAGKSGGIASRLGPIVLGLAVAGAIAAGVWVFRGGGDDSGIVPVSPMTLTPGGPTAVPGTGVFDPQRPEIGQEAPDFGLVDARDPSRVRTLSEFRGTPVVLNWYASWCGPCEKEIPAFLRAEAAAGGGVVFLGVDWMEGAEKAVSILDDNGATYPAVLDSEGKVASHYRVTGLPTTYFIDADGVVRDAHHGPISEAQLAEKLGSIGVDYTVR